MPKLNLRGFNIAFGVKPIKDESTKRFSKLYREDVEVVEFFDDARRGLGIEKDVVVVYLPGGVKFSSDMNDDEMQKTFGWFISNFGDSRSKIPISFMVEGRDFAAAAVGGAKEEDVILNFSGDLGLGPEVSAGLGEGMTGLLLHLKGTSVVEKESIVRDDRG